MITLEILEGYQTQVTAQPLEVAAQTALKQQRASLDADLTIVISDDAQLRQLNLAYRNIDSPTDVLSFAADFTDPESQIPYLGDIVISFERAAVQAEAAGHSTQAELQLLVVHGILHLLGHDHAEPAEKAEMWAAQTDVLRQLGLENIQIIDDD